MTMLKVANDLQSADPLLIDYDTREGLIARRNVLLGLWAAGRLGLTGTDAEAYAWSVHFADHGQPGHDDIVSKIATDFATAGKEVRLRTILRHLREMELRAFLQLSVEPNFGCVPS
ncbi:ATPase inhibitor subunit zeta [Xanthobacter sp. KR7-65]|uniref:DUF1476 domain-containing protein n=1 Tax=Xanthobacter sp. KR7-65 TaxID=3156612 RepID=UPI0032B3D872